MKPFHYAFKVKNLASTRQFYIDLLGCKEGRSTEKWVDFDFFGHQLSAHCSQEIPNLDFSGQVDGIAVPMPHFGCILSVDEFNGIVTKLEKASVEFIIKPTLRYKGKTGEQWTMFLLDFSNNPIEFKAFTNSDEVFGK
jgi:extradiol dioxygenase family protein